MACLLRQLNKICIRRDSVRADLNKAIHNLLVEENKYETWKEELDNLRHGLIQQAGWHPVAVQRRYGTRETTVEPVSAAARISTLQHYMADSALHMKALRTRAVRLELKNQEITSSAIEIEGQYNVACAWQSWNHKQLMRDGLADVFVCCKYYGCMNQWRW